MIWLALVAGMAAAFAHARWAARRAFRRGMAHGFEAGQKEGARCGIHVALEHMSRQYGNAILSNLAAEALSELNGRRPN